MSVIEERGQSELMREVLVEKDECLHGRWPLFRNLVVVRDVKDGKF